MARRIGESADQLRAALDHVANGVDVLYVLPSFAMLSYAVDLAASIQVPDAGVADQLEYGAACLRFASAAVRPECFEGWRGMVVFDRAALWRVSDSSRDRWGHLAHGCNVRFGGKGKGGAV